jgi:hypothetical protein
MQKHKSAITFTGLVSGMNLLPETKEKSLEQPEAILIK